MAISIANVNSQTQSFQNWLDKTNQVLHVISTNALTAQKTIAGSATEGNTILEGVFVSNTVAIPDELRGGTLSLSSDLFITSNVVINSALMYANNSNVFFRNSNTFVNSTTTYITGGTANITSNVSISNETTSIASNTFTFTTDVEVVTIQASNTVIGGSNVEITANVTVGGTNTVITSNTFFQGEVSFNGGLTVSGTSTLLGDLVIGDGAGNTVSFVAAVNTHILPDQTLRRELGSAQKIWNKIYVGTIDAVEIQYTGDLAGVNAISTNTISVGSYTNYITFSNADLGDANTAGILDPVSIFDLPLNSFRTLKMIVQLRNDNINTFSSSELLLVHDENAPLMTVYATLSTNTSAPAYTYSTDRDGSNVRVLVTPPTGAPNSSVVGQAVYIETL
jgi:hypothetical protein